MSSTVPLQWVHVQEDDRLLIVTCTYALPKERQERSEDLLDTRVALETVQFDLIEDHTAQ